MTSLVIFSKDRPAQLDLLLRSITQNASGIFSDIHVLRRASQPEYEDGYGRCELEHEQVSFHNETNFEGNLRNILMLTGETIAFACDDDVFYRKFSSAETPAGILALRAEVLCVSLRLGMNTGMCYPMSRLQGLPVFDANFGKYFTWLWRTGDADFGYPGSLDFHVWRSADIQDFFGGIHFSNPNTLEDRLVAFCARNLHFKMACYERSLVVGVPANRVTETHYGNRFGTEFFESEKLMNDKFLSGNRLSMGSIKEDKVAGAHSEFRFKWDS